MVNAITMNEQALKAAWQHAKSKGYKGDVTAFLELISTNEAAFASSYNYAKEKGYNGDEEGFSTLLGVKKNETPNEEVSVVGTESVQKDGTESTSVSEETTDVPLRGQPRKTFEELEAERGAPAAPSESYGDKIRKAREISAKRGAGRKNEDGSVSTVLMSP